MNIEHRHIEVFRAVMLAGSVTAAAARLFTSQPTVSRDLARFEQLLGFALFDRVRGRLQPTARALSLFEEVQRSWLGLERIVATASGLREFSAASLAIVCVPAFAQALLPAACRHFLALHPGVNLAITPAESPLLEEWLSAQRFDLGLTEQNTAPPGTHLEVLLEADEVCVLPAAHPLAAKARLSPQDFAGQPFVSLAPGDPYRRQLDSVFRELGVERRLQLETQTAASVCALVREGLGLAIVNPLSALEYASATLVLRPFSISIPFRVSLVRPEYRPSTPLSEDFASALRQQAEAIRQQLALASTLTPAATASFRYHPG
ncbi:LysR family transcriptional regulator [Uliginosibacterium sp. 31-12]|uniref:LysR family transcriptional regulator n=1 Tax=Uliginosibacterium sp. 31-12 TaxID=3062781 RepID=UPI0026E217AF|nr:LysR family transcriptional regulator [Uliginosibacterium sp. 31-12]MDO6387605.1 LysR family transcriptional regulator [Uliginosibacterium sp. 31-12]